MKPSKRDQLLSEKAALESEIARLEGVKRIGKRASKKDRKQLERADLPGMKRRLEELENDLAKVEEQARKQAIEEKKAEIEAIKQKAQEQKETRERAKKEYSELKAEGPTQYEVLKAEYEQKRKRMNMLRNAATGPAHMGSGEVERKVKELKDEIKALEQNPEELQPLRMTR